MAIRRVLDAHQWPSDMTRDFYLQGSYRNDTNIRGDIDVDVVLELTSALRYDATTLSRYEQGLLDLFFNPASHNCNDLRRETLRALEAGFGRGMVSPGNKSIRQRADPPRLSADVVICMQNRWCTSYSSCVVGISLWALDDKRWIVNYPNGHYRNGAAKSSLTWDRYKQPVRMFKNTRNHLESIGTIGFGLAPSYFVECLLYNAQDSAFQYSLQETFCSIVNRMTLNNLDKLICQNG